MEQQVRFCTTADGARIAYVTLGEGSPLVVPPGWISHLELDLEDPERAVFYRALARHHTLVRFDRWGCGLSDRDRSDFSLAADVRALEAVIDHLKLRRLALLGISAGGPQAVAYTARYPRRVSHLALYGTLARRSPDSRQRETQRAITALVRADWGLGSKTLTEVFSPTATAEQARWFAHYQRAAASAEVAAGLRDAAEEVDVRDLLPRIRVPTLVMHREGDIVVPFERGRELAALIPGARFVRLAGDDHVPNHGDVDAILRTLAEFLGDPAEPDRPAARATGDDATRESPPDVERRPDTRVVFLSHAAEDRATADAVLRALEGAGIGCWIAPRDIRAGQDYAEAIVEAIRASRLVVVVFSGAANRSPHVRRELERATSADLPILPVRVEDVRPSAAMEYFLSTPHWLDAFPGPIEPQLQRLTETARQLLTAHAP